MKNLKKFKNFIKENNDKLNNIENDNIDNDNSEDILYHQISKSDSKLENKKSSEEDEYDLIDIFDKEEFENE